MRKYIMRTSRPTETGWGWNATGSWALGATLATALHSVALAAALWQGSQTGMTLDEVKRVYSGPMETTVKSGQELASGVNAVSIAAQHFHPIFVFNDGKLAEVNLIEKMDKNLGTTLMVFESVKAELSSKYGPPTGESTIPGTEDATYIRTTEFEHEGTKISLVGFAGGSDSAILIKYSAGDPL